MPRFLLLFFLAASGFALLAQKAKSPAPSSTQAIYDAQAQSVDKKFAYIVKNGSRSTPDQTPTIINEGELNAWLQSGEAGLPEGVERLQLFAHPGIIRATATVDFDKITAGAPSSNPLLALFSGTHEVEARAQAQGRGGMGEVNIESVSIDGVTVPKMALEYFADKYIRPKHPELGVDSRFQLPHKIDIARVGARQVTLTQK